jgi:hypothetical protein
MRITWITIGFFISGGITVTLEMVSFRFPILGLMLFVLGTINIISDLRDKTTSL